MLEFTGVNKPNTATVESILKSVHYKQAVHGYGAKPGTKKALCLAMYLMPQGATTPEIQAMLNEGGLKVEAMLNCWREAPAALCVKESGKRKVKGKLTGKTVYRLSLTEKAKAAVKAAKKPAKK